MVAVLLALDWRSRCREVRTIPPVCHPSQKENRRPTYVRPALRAQNVTPSSPRPRTSTALTSLFAGSRSCPPTRICSR